MKCPKCTTDSAVYSIRDMKNGKYKIRSQTCKNKDCLLQFDSIEYAIPLGADIYIVPDGTDKENLQKNNLQTII